MSFADVLAATYARLDTRLFASLRDRIDPAWVEEALARPDGVTVRHRKLPALVVVWVVIGACLFAHWSFTDVVRHLGLVAKTRRGSVPTDPSSGSIAQARARVSGDAMGRLLRRAASTWAATAAVTRYRWRGLMVLASDGVEFRTPDTPANASTYGRRTVKNDGESPNPAVRAVTLLEVASHLVLDARLGGIAIGEKTLIEELVPTLPDRSVTILDRGFYSFGLLHRIQRSGTERHWLVRAHRDCAARRVRELGPGDWLVEVRPSASVRAKDPLLPVVYLAREIRYTAGGTHFVLLTSLVDPTRYPAAELSALYRERWETEIAFDDIKTEQRGAAPVLRSKTPDGIAQEVFGILLAHDVVRFEMALAAEAVGLPPRRLSFHRSLQLIVHHLHCFRGSSAPTKAADREMDLRRDLAFLVLPERRSERSYPRAVKARYIKYPLNSLMKPALKEANVKT